MQLKTLTLFTWQHATLILFGLFCLITGSAIKKTLISRMIPVRTDSLYTEPNTWISCFFSLTLGLFYLITWMFLLGAVGLLYPLVILAIMGVSLLFSVYVLYRQYADKTSLLSLKHTIFQSKTGLIVLILLFVSCVFTYVRVPGLWDDTMYHLPLAKFYMEHHAIELMSTVRMPLIPQNINLLFTWGLMFGNELLVQGLATFPLFILLMGLIGVCRWKLKSWFATALVLLLVLLSDAIAYYAGYAYVDIGLGLFCFAAMLSVFIMEDSADSSQAKGWINYWIVLAAIFSGAAVGTKVFGLIYAGAIGLWLLLQRHWKLFFKFTVMTLLFGCGWYIRSWWYSGNPVHPLLPQIFGHFLWDIQDYHTNLQENLGYFKSFNPFVLWSALEGGDKSILLFALAALALWKPKDKTIRCWQFFYLIAFTAWFTTNQISRYLTPAIPIGAFLLVYVTKHLVKKIKQADSPKLDQVLAVLLLLPLPLLSYSKAANQLKAGTNHYLDKKRPDNGFSGYEKANEYIPIYGDRLLQLGLEQGIYFFNGTVIGEHFGSGRYRQFVNCTPANCQLIPPLEMINKMKELNTRMLLINMRSYTNQIPSDYPKYFDLLFHDEGKSILLTIRPTPLP
jgi:hypothetical protein